MTLCIDRSIYYCHFAFMSLFVGLVQKPNDHVSIRIVENKRYECYNKERAYRDKKIRTELIDRIKKQEHFEKAPLIVAFGTLL